jgi:hypothetical protein
MNARRLNYRPRGLDTGMVAIPKCDQEEVGNVRFGSEADMCSATRRVCFAPNSDRKSRHAANGHVRFIPKSGRVRCTGSCLLWANSGR